MPDDSMRDASSTRREALAMSLSARNLAVVSESSRLVFTVLRSVHHTMQDDAVAEKGINSRQSYLSSSPKIGRGTEKKKWKKFGGMKLLS